MNRQHRLNSLCALLFLTGFTAIVIQVLAIRAFSIVLGNTLYSLSCVVASYMLGMATGSFLVEQLTLARRAFVYRYACQPRLQQGRACAERQMLPRRLRRLEGLVVFSVWLGKV